MRAHRLLQLHGVDRSLHAMVGSRKEIYQPAKPYHILIQLLAQALSRPQTAPAQASALALGASLRADFPILSQEVNGRPLMYLDNAATSQKPVVGRTFPCTSGPGCERGGGNCSYDTMRIQVCRYYDVC